MHPSSRPAINCPECGAPLTVRSAAAAVVVCEYCRSSVSLGEGEPSSRGTSARLAEGFTRLYTGAAGWLRGAEFLVLGRARYRYTGGLWDEWYLSLGPNRYAWITEDDHLLSIQSVTPGGAEIEPVVGLSPGARFDFEGALFEVDEIGHAVCDGIEGELPRDVRAGEGYRYLDASSVDGRLSLGVELDGDPPGVFRGKWLAHTDVRLADEGLEW